MKREENAVTKSRNAATKMENAVTRKEKFVALELARFLTNGQLVLQFYC